MGGSITSSAIDDLLASGSLSSALELLDNGVITSSELLEAQLARIEQYDPAINAVVAMDLDRARAEAQAADDARTELLAAGGDLSELGQLRGVPMTIKDTYETEGLRTVAGAPALTDHVPTSDADMTMALRQAGAIVFAKTNVPLYAGDHQSYNDVYGTTNNPHDLTRTPGGSSGGAAAAVASGFSLIEVGSDIGASIRLPSHFNGVFGIKPTHGVLSLRGHIPGPPGSLALRALSVAGPIGRSVRDLEILMDVLAKVGSFGNIPGASLAPPTPRPVSELRIGLWSDDEVAPVAAGVKATVEGLGERLAAAGAVVEVAHPDIASQELHDLYQYVLMAEMGAGFPAQLYDALDDVARAARAAEAEFGPMENTAHWVTTSYKDWLGANEAQAKAIASWDRLFESVDIVLAPPAPTVAFPHNSDVGYNDRLTDVDGVQRPYKELLFWAGIATMPLLPSVVIPAGSSNGLPCGVQLIAKRWSDLQLLSDAGAICNELDIGFVPPTLDFGS